MVRARLASILFVLASVAMAWLPPASAATPRLTVGVVQGGLVHPWDLAFAPGGRMLVTERPGRVRVYASSEPGARLLATTTVSGVEAQGEGGAMGIAVAPARDGSRPFVFVCASRMDGGGLRNQVLRYRLDASGRLAQDGYLIRDRMRAGPIHNGCAVEVDDQGRVLVAMGDGSEGSLAQRLGGYNGKILRAHRDGSVPAANPVIAGRRSLIYTLGHRNPQGLALRYATGVWYAVEHGPERDDEINLLQPGRNYGWPCYTATRRYSDCASENTAPAWASGMPTIATSGGTFVRGRQWGSWNGDFFASTLKESDLRRFHPVDGGRRLVQGSVLLDGRFGRLRAATINGYGHLFVTTSNGAGDRVIRITASS